MELQVVQGRQTAAGYVRMLQKASLVTEGHRLCGDGWLFQQDNAAIHLLRHPVCSPDLNPIEKCLGRDGKRCLSKWQTIFNKK